MQSDPKMQTGTRQEKVFALLADPRFDAQDFRERWSRARIAAIRSVLTAAKPCMNESEEAALLLEAGPSQRDAVLRAVFDFSRKFGIGLSKFLGLSLEVQDFEQLLPVSGSPCIGGSWLSHNGASLTQRPGCSLSNSLGTFGCDYWREALDGFVMGVSDDVRLARHRSVGHGDSDCLDVLFLDSGTGPKLGFHHGKIPAELEQGLAVIALHFGQKGILISWDGFSEGVLFYRMEAGALPLCGAGGQLMHDALKADFNKLFPEIKLRDASPMAVMGEEK